MTDSSINLQEFLDGYKTVEIYLKDKKWVFREPTLRELLNITEKDDLDKTVRGLLLDGNMEELDQALNDLTKSQKELFIAKLLSDLGLVSKAVVDEIKSTTIK